MEPSSSTSSDTLNNSPVRDAPKVMNRKSKGKGGKEARERRKIQRVVDQEAPLDKAWVPVEHKNRTLVLCFDGTGDHFDSDVRIDNLAVIFADSDPQ